MARVTKCQVVRCTKCYFNNGEQFITLVIPQPDTFRLSMQSGLVHQTLVQQLTELPDLPDPMVLIRLLINIFKVQVHITQWFQL